MPKNQDNEFGDKNNLGTSLQTIKDANTFFSPRSARYYACLLQYAKSAKSNEAILRK